MVALSSVIKVVGIDISLNNLGMCLASIDMNSTSIDVSDITLVSPDKADKATKKVTRVNSDDLRRGRLLHAGIQSALKEWSPFLVMVEMPVGSQSARAMASYGLCVGVLSAIEIPFIEVTPYEVKIAATGSKTATKDEMIRWAVDKYPALPWLKSRGSVTKANEHIADAIAAVHAGVDSADFLRLMAMRSRIAA